MKRQWPLGKAAMICISLTVALFASYQIAWAAVSITNQTGTITITTPTGEVITVEAGQPLPSIPSGSTIEVITGNADISASGGDSINVLINNATALVKDGAQVNVAVDLRTGDATLNVVAGNVPLTQPDGTVQTFAPGDSTSVGAPAPVSTTSLDVPGADPAATVGRQEDIESGVVTGY